MILPFLTLEPLDRGSDAALLLLRLIVGGFLVYGVWDNVVSPERMAEFAAFLTRFGFPFPQIMAPLSVWAQFLCGAAFILGLATRWAGLICAFNFAVALAMVDHKLGIRASFPSACLIGVGLLLATYGPGQLALDRLFAPRGEIETG